MTEYKHLGWVPVNEDGSPTRPFRVNYMSHKVEDKPPRIYQTQKRAESQSPVGKAKEVLIEM